MTSPGIKHPIDVNSTGYGWYWRNYEACLRWQERHSVAYWKSRALALEYERNALLQYVHDVKGANSVPCEPKSRGHFPHQEVNLNTIYHHSRKRSISQRHTKSKRSRNYEKKEDSFSNKKHERKAHSVSSRKSYHKNDQNYAIDKEAIDLDEENEYNSDPIIEDELIEFFKQTMRHKMELRQRRKAFEESDSTDSSSYPQNTELARSEKMRMLYGKDSAKIQGMETAMQLTFERNCDILNPVLWPVLPLKM